MEIKTLVEVRGGRVSIEIRAEQDEVAEISNRLSPSRENQRVHDLGRMAGQEDRIADLEAELAREKNRADRATDAFNESQRQLQESRKQLTAEKDRADWNKDWAERAEARVVEMEAELRKSREATALALNDLETEQRKVREQEGVLGQTKAAVSSNQVRHAMDLHEPSVPMSAHPLIEAIKDIRRIVGKVGE